MLEKLRFRRQFLLAKAPIFKHGELRSLQVGPYYLYYHPDLEVTREEDSKKKIVLIGSLFDSVKPELGNSDILKNTLVNTNSMEQFILWMRQFAGCYAVLYFDDKEGYILQDARGSRDIYYCTKDNQIVCGSQPNLLAKFAKPPVSETSDPILIDFFKNHLWDSRWIGDESYWEDIKHLLPNHYLSINKREVYRYWPKETIKRLSLEEAVTKSCNFLEGIIKAIVHRHSVMTAVTAGTDSRIVLAASRESRNKIYYFVNNHGLGYSHPDIEIPKRMFKDIGEEFHEHSVLENVDDEFRKIYFSNTFLATDRLLPAIYNVFYKGHSEKVCILGMGEIGRNYYGMQPQKLDSYRMAYILGYRNCSYVNRQCEKILCELLPVAKKFGVNVLTLLYLEQRLGNWAATRNSEAGIAIEKIDPYDSHLLYELFLGVDEKFRNYQQTPCILFREIIRKMWPELLEWPINPAHGFKSKIISAMKKIGIVSLVKELMYRMYYLKNIYIGSKIR